jgi:UTP--glucose-1-phosphate uridylyltransferase
MENQITTAVIAVAGWGTRWLPLTKAVEKCMLPVGNRPIIDWIVEDCVNAGITRIIIVIGEEHTQVQRYFSHHVSLERMLANKGKNDMLQAVAQPQYNSIHFEFVIQSTSDKYGTAIPPLLAGSKLEANEPFILLNGDDFIYRTDGGNELTDFIATWRKSGGDGALMVVDSTPEEATQYADVVTDDNNFLIEIREKPSLASFGDRTTAKANLGKYIFTQRILQDIAAYAEKPSPNANGEYYVTDIFNDAAASGQRFAAHAITGQHLDTGNPTSWLRTNQIVMNH